MSEALGMIETRGLVGAIEAADAAAFADKAKDAIIIVEKGSAGEELVAPVE